ncbi:MAG: hypothetical protein DMF96_00200 [Acidobacteria bacterium]|nr:MAG: hypothetical protein DMF96_00200 [Acidobacteriota bacterium]
MTVTRTFAITGPLDGYTLRVVNRGVTSAVIALNGRAVLNPEDFKGRKGKDEEKDKKGDKDRDNKDSDKGKDKGRYDRDGDSDFVPLIERPVDLRAGNNQIAVELRGKPGASLTVEILRTAPLDTTPPTITATPNPPPNANGWNNTAVTVTFTCADAGSGIAICPAAVVVSGEGANQVISGTATAGNTAEASVTLNIDKTAPIVTASQSPDANARGWNNGPVVVTFAATDALSGVEPGTLSAPVTLSGDGANQSVPGQARDLAGNVGSVTRAGINIDQARPIITVALSPDPGPGGFAAVPVTAHFSCSDALSGVLTCPFDQVVGQEGSNLTATGTVTDFAGNNADVTSAPFGVDLTPPTITLSVPPANANSWYNAGTKSHSDVTALRGEHWRQLTL